MGGLRNISRGEQEASGGGGRLAAVGAPAARGGGRTRPACLRTASLLLLPLLPPKLSRPCTLVAPWERSRSRALPI